MRRFVFFLFSVVAFGAVKVGEAPPEIRLDRLIPDQPVEKATLAALKGKAVVLDFWATWCGPCIDQIPEWNQLATQFKGRPIVFLAVTPENPAAVQLFLKKRPIEGWVGIGDVAETYGLTGVGHKFLIDADGKVAAIATGKKLTVPLLEDLLAGRPVMFPPDPPRYETKIRTDEPGSAPPVANVIIRPTTVIERGGGTGRGKDEIMFRATPLRIILSSIYRVIPPRIIGEPAEDTTRYDAWISLPGASRETFEAFTRNVVCAGLHVSAEREMRDTEVYLLTAPNGKPPGLVEAVPAGGIVSGLGKGSLKLKGPFLALAGLLERPLGQPVIDETRIDGTYDIKLTYEDGSTDSAIQAVEKLGLKLTKARRPIEFLVVKKAQ